VSNDASNPGTIFPPEAHDTSKLEMPSEDGVLDRPSTIAKIDEEEEEEKVAMN